MKNIHLIGLAVLLTGCSSEVASNKMKAIADHGPVIFIGSLLLLKAILSFLMREKASLYLMHVIINATLLAGLAILVYIERNFIFRITDGSSYLLLFIILFTYSYGIIRMIRDLKEYKNMKIKGTNE